jgi:hypothetical protein
MGQEIIYCDRCANRIGGADFDRGKAFRVAGKGICASCTTPEEQQAAALSSSARNKSTTRIKTPKLGPGTSAKIPAARPDTRVEASKTPLLLGLSGAALLVVAGGYWLMSASKSAPEPETISRPPVSRPAIVVEDAPKEKPEDPPLKEAREAVEAARARMKSSPNDFEAQRVAWEEAARKAALTPYFKEASQELQAAKDRMPLVKPPEPVKPVDPPVAPPVPPPTEPPRPAGEVAASPALWAAAMAKASAFDFEGAASELRKEAAGNREADDLVQAGAALVQSRQELASLPAGQPIAVTYRSDLGDRKRAEGVLVRAWAARLEIKQGEETIFVENTDITAGSLVELCHPSTSLRRRYALLCLLEGDRDSAERLAGADAFSARYWDYAKEAASKLPKVAPHELEARRLFYAAERDFGKPETLADAIGRYKTLMESYADTAVVKGEQVRIRMRADAGKDFVLSAFQLKGTGTFGIVAYPRSEAAWTSKMDIDGAQSLGNYVEGEFTALAGTSYKAWALIGACCAETFTFYLQTTEGTDLNPKTKQRESIEPGAGIASLVKHSIKELAKSHRSHVTKIAKAPTKWEWIAIPLPKYAAAGAKKIRLLSDQQGFSVGAIVVSATRTAPPTDAELKEAATRAKATVVEQGFSPDNPGEKPWRPLFDGKTKESVLRGAAPGWKVEDGKLVALPGINDAAQTHEEFKNTEIRIRFEAQGLERLWFNFRQGAPGAGYSISLESNLQAMDGKHELIYKAEEEKVTATLDGKPIAVTVLAPASLGCLQFNGTGKRFAVLSIDVRP